MSQPDFNLESRLAATTSVSLILAKEAVRAKLGSEEEKETLCCLLEDLFRAGFADGALFVANSLLKAMQP